MSPPEKHRRHLQPPLTILRFDTLTPFRNEFNQRLTKSLFFETNIEGKDAAIYTLKDRDHTVGDKVYKSLYRLYMEMRDPLEFEFANTYLDGWEHWTMLSEATWFVEYITRWRYELELAIRSSAYRRLEKDAASGSRTSAQANRYLVDGKWREKNTKGRPSKADVKKEAKILAERKSDEDADYQRIFAGSPELTNVSRNPN